MGLLKLLPPLLLPISSPVSSSRLHPLSSRLHPLLSSRSERVDSFREAGSHRPGSVPEAEEAAGIWRQEEETGGRGPGPDLTGGEHVRQQLLGC